MQSVTHLQVVEPVSVDQTTLEILYSEVGFAAAEEIVCRAMEQLALRLAQCDSQFKARDLDRLDKTVKSLIAVAEQVGMTLLARAGADVRQAMAAGDAAGMAACVARMARIGEGSLMAVWDLQDMSI